MPEIEFICPHCSSHLEVQPDQAGRTLPCPGCRHSVVVPTETRLPLPADTREAKTVAATACPFCGQSMAPDDVLCVSCGRMRDGDKVAPAKTRNLAVLIAIPAAAVLLIAIVAGIAVPCSRRAAARRKQAADQAAQDARRSENAAARAEAEAAEAERARAAEQARRAKQETQAALQREQAARARAAEQAARQEQLKAEAARRAAEQEELRRQREAAAQRVRAQFDFDAAPPPAKRLHMKDGSILIATEIEEKDGQYACTVPNKTRTIYATRLISKDAVQRIDAEGPDAPAWAVLSKARLRPDSEQPAYYEMVIELCFDTFLEKHPDSKYREQAEALRDAWRAELKRVRQGYAKAAGRWYAPGQDVPKALPAQTQRLLAFIRGQINAGRHDDALRNCARVQIPETEQDKERFLATSILHAISGARGLYKQRADQLNTEQTQIEQRYDDQKMRVEQAKYTPGERQSMAPGEARRKHVEKERNRQREFDATRQRTLQRIEARRKAELEPIQERRTALHAEIAVTRELAEQARAKVRDEQAGTRIEQAIARLGELSE